MTGTKLASVGIHENTKCPGLENNWLTRSKVPPKTILILTSFTLCLIFSSSGV